MEALSGAAGDDRDEIRSLLLLDRVPGIGLSTLRRLVRRFGSARRALQAPTDAFGQVDATAAKIRWTVKHKRR